MKHTAMLQSDSTEEQDRDRPSTPDVRLEIRRPPWVLILSIPVMIVGMLVAIGILDLIMRLFGT